MDGAGIEWDYVIVGSGAGGGTLAARLVEAGMRVCVLEAGGDPLHTEAHELPDDYDVPGFHPFACENAAMRWDFRVRHYADETTQARDPKYDAAAGGVLYPRAGTLGGCTAHNAMIFMLAHDSDWDGIAELTGDASWRARHMRRYARRLEACHHRPVWRALRHAGINPTGHGWEGWLRTEAPLDLKALDDAAMDDMIAGTAYAYFRKLRHRWKRALHWLYGAADPNARPWGSRSFEGLCYTPLATADHRRFGTRERLRRAQAQQPDRLHIELDALATRVLFDAAGSACGVEYLKGARLYQAAAHPSPAAGVRREVRARREVILCGGAFNTPQLLMLSGIGPDAHLRSFGIPVRVDLPGVGRNLQDRYEVAVTHRMRRPWVLMQGVRFEQGDPVWRSWNQWREGLYASNGAAMAFVRRSRPVLAAPDIFCMALPVRFQGYFPGFSQLMRERHEHLTWTVLKGHTQNRAGSVTLRSADPRAAPLVNFRYFEPGGDGAAQDLQALVQAIEFVRSLTRPLIERGVIAEECQPGPGVDTPERLAEYVRDTAWGHHASCSCPIGRAEEGGVVDSNFIVHGTRNLRVVDASVFPRIPGLFLVSAVYMIAEKAADGLLAAASRAGR
jgi:choline dehydrogenase-like flavoprotein